MAPPNELGPAKFFYHKPLSKIPLKRLLYATNLTQESGGMADYLDMKFALGPYPVYDCPMPKLVALNLRLALLSLLGLALNAVPESAATLEKAPLCIVQVEDPHGQPAPGVTAVCVDPSTDAFLKGPTIEGGGERFQTDAHGRFSLPLNKTNVAVVVASDNGFSLAQSSDLVKIPTMIVRPWGRIEGRRLNCGEPVVGQRLRYRLPMSFLCSKELQQVWIGTAAVATDAEGRFVFDFVPPVDILLSGMQKHPGKYYSMLKMEEIKPGETNWIEIATHGRTIVGHLEFEPESANQIDLTSLHVGLMPKLDTRKTGMMPSIPEEFNTSASRGKWMRAWYATEAGRQRLEMFSKSYSTEIHPDGSFIADLIEPGEYVISGDLYQNEKQLAVLSESIEIPPGPPNAENEPFDLGKITFKTTMNVGDEAPDFTARTLDGKPLQLSTFRGEFVLLDFWATWCGPCVAETPNLKETYDAFGKNERFRMISLSLDSDAAAPKKFTHDHGIAWNQVFLDGAFNNITMHNYRFDAIPQILLIGPDGKILAKDLRGEKIKQVVATALAPP
jgi:peroxiredoxin